MAGRRAVVRGRGHPEIRATHAKTLEFTRESAVSTRATCVVGVDTELDPVELGLIRGEVRLVINAAGHEASGHAVINPSHQIADQLVIRRSPYADAGTLAVEATLTASDLSPEFVTALTDPATVVTLTITEMVAAAPLVLVRPAGEPVPTGRLGLLWRHADASIHFGTSRDAQNPQALADRGRIVAASLPGPLDTTPEAATLWFASAAQRGARFAVLGSHPGPAETLLSAGLPTAPALFLGRLDRRSVRRPEIEALLRSGVGPTVLTIPIDETESVLERVIAAGGGRAIAVPDPNLDVGTAVTWTTVEQAAHRSRTSNGDPVDVTVVLAARPSTGAPIDLDALVRALVAAGVSAKTLSTALEPFGLTRKRVYSSLSPGQPPAAEPPAR